MHNHWRTRTFLRIESQLQTRVCILKPVAETLDEVQKNLCSIGHAVYLWKQLKNRIWDVTQDENIKKKFICRYDMAVTPAHFLAYMLDPKLINATK